MDKVNLRVLLKEPRGFIRILQVLFSLMAWSTIAGFTTTSILEIYCPDSGKYTAEYKISYPFDLRSTEVNTPYNCSTDDTELATDTFPIDFSATSMLFVLVCVISFIYASCAAGYYCLLGHKYENDPLAPVLDLSLTFVITVAWFIITCTWALNVSDLKHYTHPTYFRQHLAVCSTDSDANCQPANPGKWSSLVVSIVCGFTCSIMWLGSTWFIFKETSLHKKPQYQAGGQQGVPEAGGSQYQ